MPENAPRFRRRPALWTATAFAAGIGLGSSVATPPWAVYAGASALWCVLVFTRSGPKTGPLYLLLFVLLGLGCLQSVTHLSPPDHILRQPAVFERDIRIRGTVDTAVRSYGRDRRFALALHNAHLDGRTYDLSGRVLVRDRVLFPPVALGDTLVLDLRLRQPPPRRNPGAFDYRRYLAHRGIDALATLKKPEQWHNHRSGQPPLWQTAAAALRRSMEQSLRRNLRGPPADLLVAMLLGDKHRLPTETVAAFRRAGLAHALVISGLHVGLVALFSLTALRLCRLPETWAGGGTLVVLALFALVGGLQAPVVRASVMAAAFVVGRLRRRNTDAYNALGLAALALLAARPQWCFDLGFHLSFAATFAIVHLYGAWYRLTPASWHDEHGWRGRWLAAPLGVSLAAQIGTAPLVAYHFHQLSTVAPLANLAALPLLGAAVGLGLLSCIASLCAPPLAPLFNGCNYLVLKALLLLSEVCAALPWAALPLGRPSGLALAVCGVAVLAPPFLIERPRWRKPALAALLASLNLAVWDPVLSAQQLEAIFFDVGQGDAAFVRFPNGRTLVIDGGKRNPDFDFGERVLLPFLRQRGIERIDAVVGSHAHNDHIGGLAALVEEIEVGHYLDSGQAPPSSTARALLHAVQRRGTRYHRVRAGDRLAGLGDAEALVLHPLPGFVDTDGTSPHGVNNGSVVLRLRYGEVELLFTGDIEKEAGAALLVWGGLLRSDVLKVAHHGSRTSSSAAFLAAVRPHLALVSLGAYNRFGHPAPQVLARLDAVGAQVVRTDQRGALTLKTDGRNIAWSTSLTSDAPQGLAAIAATYSCRTR